MHLLLGPPACLWLDEHTPMQRDFLLGAQEDTGKGESISVMQGVSVPHVGIGYANTVLQIPHVGASM